MDDAQVRRLRRSGVFLRVGTGRSKAIQPGEPLDAGPVVLVRGAHDADEARRTLALRDRAAALGDALADLEDTAPLDWLALRGALRRVAAISDWETIDG